jgi:pyrroline-5-carboxylate reductase
MRLGVIGCGRLARSIVKGVLDASLCTKQDVLVSVQTDLSKSEILRNYDWTLAKTNSEVAQFADVILLAVKPSTLALLFAREPNLADALANKLVISVLVGIKLHQLGAKMPETSLVRCMTNIACSVQCGMHVFCSNSRTSQEQMQLVLKLFSSMGRCQLLEEGHFDVVTALCASSPAFFGLIADAMVDAGVLMGLQRHIAVEIIMQSMLGTAQLVLKSQSTSGASFGLMPSQLKEAVMTPAGCTAAGIYAMEHGSIRATLLDTVVKCTERAKELGSS